MMTLEELRRYLHAAYIDLRLFATGKADPDLPPLRLRDVGQGDFRRIGEELAALLVRAGKLQPDDRVLDIGCGIGRVAIPLTRVLSPAGSYDGFDIVKRWIRWCRRNITPKHPNFRFAHADIYNSHYNRSGVPATEFRFHYADGSFDFAFATSVFTHLDVEAMRHYLAEAHRVLRPGGTLLSTFFLLDDDIKPRLGTDSALNFQVDRGSYRLLDAADPDWAIAIEHDLLANLLPPPAWHPPQIEHGFWRHRGGTSFQDVVLATRR
jgi:SAM-dependent methyltransferase